jgi:hypothetical protein
MQRAAPVPTNPVEMLTAQDVREIKDWLQSQKQPKKR